MRYIDRRFLLPVAAATAWGQQQPPEAAAAEAALRARVEQFFQLQVDKKFRQAESLVAEDSKDGYYEANKYNIKSFRIDKVEFLEGGNRARVTIKAKVTIMAPAAGVFDIDAPSTSLWKLENGQWSYYLDKQQGLETPFGKIMPTGNNSAAPQPQQNAPGKIPDFSSMMKLVKLDRTAVALNAGTPTQTVTVSNELPGGVDLEIANTPQQGFSVKVDKKHLEAGEKTEVHITTQRGGEDKSLLRINVSPLNIALDIQVTKE